MLSAKWWPFCLGFEVVNHDQKANDIDGFVQDCSNSSASAMELLQSCIKPPIYRGIPLPAEILLMYTKTPPG